MSTDGDKILEVETVERTDINREPEASISHYFHIQ